jgi:hypothetical protein
MKKAQMKRVQIFGDASCMGSDVEVSKEFEDMDAAEAVLGAEERDILENEIEHEKMRKRGMKNLAKY